jgi:hypothetical protein
VYVIFGLIQLPLLAHSVLDDDDLVRLFYEDSQVKPLESILAGAVVLTVLALKIYLSCVLSAFGRNDGQVTTNKDAVEGKPEEVPVGI